MRLILIAALGAALVGCSGDDTGSDTDTTDTDTGTESTTSVERLGVPEKYEILWNTTEGCETSNGPGIQVYWHTGDAVTTELSNGRFKLEATETWYWFNGNNSLSDCKDTWRITGESITTDYALLGCAGCEEAYSFRRELVESSCGVSYHQIFAYDEDMEAPDEQVYDGYLLFDTHNEFNDEPNQNNKMLVVARFRRPDNAYGGNNDYGLSGMSYRYADDPVVQGPPGEYEWVGSACIGTGGDGGGGA